MDNLKQKHAELPWEVVEHSWSDSSIYSEKDKNRPICTLSIRDIATEANQEKLGREMDADAEFIVRACNSYYEMLKALELTAALNQYLTEKECTQDTWRWITEVRNAIKTKVE